jgi:cell division protease FtsH
VKERVNIPDGSSRDEQKHRDQIKRWMTIGGVALLVASLAFLVINRYIAIPQPAQVRDIPYSEFKDELKAGQIISVVIEDTRITGRMAVSGDVARNQTVQFSTTVIPTGDPKLVDELEAAKIEFGVAQPAGPDAGTILLRLLPVIGVCGAGFVVYKRTSGSGGGLGSLVGMDKGRAAEVKPADVSVTFKDVGGADEAITELQEIIQFLTAPEKFARLGGRVPKGVLLVGPPGTGKTLLAKATAGEANVRFFQTGGSEFMEMFVGVGAARVRSLFEQARKAAPSVVFIDEIDSIGQSRSGAGSVRSGANDERDQTLNQLLAEIDGFRAETGKPVIIMAATNRPEVLDPALMRAGRFDRQIAVSQPDLVGRLQVLNIHCRDIKLTEDFDQERAARMTPGFCGADLSNVMNEAALLAARRNADAVGMEDFEAAIERVVAGLEHRSTVMNPRERTAIAYHEAGHALVAGLVPCADPVAKISIIPRGKGALGYTMQMPTEDRYLLTASELEDRIAVMLGGRAAEKTVLGEVSTGASDDISKATDLARRMVTEFGMSEKLGSVRYAGQQLQYLAGAAGDNGQLSPQTREMIDVEVQRIVTEQYDRAQRLLTERMDALHYLTRELMDRESLDGSYVTAALTNTARLAA